MTIDVKRVGGLILSAGVSAVLTIGYIIYAGRALGPAEYADFSAGLSVIYLFSLAMSPVTPTIARLVTRYAARGDIAAVASLRGESLKRMMTYGVVAGLLLIAAAFPLSAALNFRTVWPLVLALLAALLFALLSVDRGVLHGLMRFRTHNVNTLLEAGVRAAGAIVLLQWARNATAALLSYAVALLLAEIVIAARFASEWRHVPRINVDWSEMKRLTVPMTILMLSIAVFQNGDVLAVKRWFAAGEAGVYGAASAVARAFGVIFVPLYVLAGPLLTSSYEAGRPIRGQTLQLCAVFVGLSAIPLALFVIWPDRIMTALYGVPYAGAGPLVARLGGVAIITYTALMLAQALITVGDFRFLSVYAAGAAIQIAVLAVMHHNVNDVINGLYLPQGAVLIIVTIVFFRCSKLSSRAYTKTQTG